MKTRVICFLLTVIIFPVFLFAQKQKLNSHPNPDDTTSLYEMVLLSDIYSEKFPDSALYLSNLVLKLISENKSQIPQVQRRLKQIKGYAFVSIGFVNEIYNYIPNAVLRYEQSLETFKAINDKRGEAMALNNLAQIYEGTGDTSVAFKYYQQSLALIRLANDRLSESDALNNIAKIYKDRKQYGTALEIFNQSLAIRRELNDTSGIANSLNNLGSVYFVMGNYNEAERYFTESIPLREKVNDLGGLASSLINLAYVYLGHGKKKEALEIANKAMVLGLRLKQPAKIKSAANILYAIYKKAGDSENALVNYKLYIKMNDSLNAEVNKKASIKSQLKYEYEKKAIADSIRVGEEKKLAAIELKQQKTQRYGLYGGLALMIVFAGFMVNRFRVAKKQKEVIHLQKNLAERQKHIVEEKQKEVLDSINYASRIQRALLTPERYIERVLSKIQSNNGNRI